MVESCFDIKALALSSSNLSLDNISLALAFRLPPVSSTASINFTLDRESIYCLASACGKKTLEAPIRLIKGEPLRFKLASISTYLVLKASPNAVVPNHSIIRAVVAMRSFVFKISSLISDRMNAVGRSGS